MALIPAFHETYGWCLVPEGKVRLHPEDWSTYEPTAHNAPDVIAYLRGAGPRERDRVLAVEHAQATPRKTVLAFGSGLDTPAPQTPADEAHTTQIPDAVGAGTTTPTGPVPGTNMED